MADTTKDRILDAARNIMRSVGAEGLTVDAAADLAGVTRKTVYNHFEGKRALIDEALSSWMGNTLASLETLANDPDLAFVDKLNTIVELGFAQLRAGGRILGRPRSERTDAPEMQHGLRDTMRGFIERMVTDASRVGLIRPEFDSRRLSWVFINIVEGLIFLENVDDEPFSKADILRDSLQAVVAGILSPDGTSAMRNSSIFKPEASHESP
jgi:AcrR family transcriptional regulator